VPYFDHNATTPLAPRAREAWLRAADEAWQNPSSPYRDAARVRAGLEQAREQLALQVGCPPDHVVFNSGATEGANAVFAHWARGLPCDRLVAVNPTEHPCVREAARHWIPPERLITLEIDGDGVVRLESLAALLAADAPRAVGAVAVMAANNETGVVQPWSEIAALCHRRRVAYLCDAAQWLGKRAAAGLGEAGWITASAHKFGGPKGVGFLVFPAQADGFRSQRGGEQEGGHRAGTEDYPAVAAMVAALGEADPAQGTLEAERRRWREAFRAKLTAAIPAARVVGAGAERLWNTVSLLMPHSENHRWVLKLDRRGFQASTGSACATGKEGPSPVLAAMGFAPDKARRVIRLSAGWSTTEADWQGLATALGEIDAELSAIAGPVSP
jgi:cysteine desulfurase